MAAERVARRLLERTAEDDRAAAGRRRLDDLARTYFGGHSPLLDRYLAMTGLTAEAAAARCAPGGADGDVATNAPGEGATPTRNHPLAHDHAGFEAALAVALEGIDTPLDVAAVLRAAGGQYATTTEELAAPSIVLEMQIARASARRAREHFQQFLTALRDARCEPVLQTYPVLRRLLAEHRRRDHEAIVETMQRLAADRQLLADHLGIPTDDAVCDLAAVGDRHRGGRRTTVLAFASGRRVVYKPRPLDTVVVFGRVVAWLDEVGVRPTLRAPAVVLRDGYGWCEWIAARGCSTPSDVDSFYERMGVLCGLMYLLDATDLHLENVIAAGEHPVVIDLETLFHNDPPGADAFWANPLGDTVLRSGLLPWRYHGRGGAADLSAIGARSGQPAPHLVQRWEGLGTGDLHLGPEEQAFLGPADNSAHLDGVPSRAQDHVGPLLAGLRLILGVAAARRGELLDLLAEAAAVPSRHVVRPTASYGELLRHGRHPTLLGDAVERDCFLAARLLRGDVDLRIVRSELEALWRDDIPLCTTTPAGRALVLDDGTTIDDHFPRSSLERTRDRIVRLDAAAVERQTYCARLSIEVLDAAGPPPGPPPGPTGAGRPYAAPCPPGTLLDEAVAIGDRLATLALRGDGHVTWPGVLSTGDDYHFGLTGPDVYNGAAGIAIFLAHLARHTGRGDLADLARRAVRGSAEQLARRRPALGALISVTGLLLAVDHVAATLEDPRLRADIAPAAGSLAAGVEADTTFDVIGGGAGTLLVLLALGRADPDVPTIVGRIAERLRAEAIRDADGACWPNPHSPVPLLGFGHGTAGIALALGRYATFAGDDRAADLALEALAHGDAAWDAGHRNWPDLRNGPEHPQATNAWCHGAPGEIAARHALAGVLGPSVGRAHLDAATEQVLDCGLGGNDSLCHGDLGNLACIAPFVRDRRPDLLAAVDAAVARRVDAHRATGRWTCGVALGLETPGLFVGSAGIGLALLAHLDPTIPSILTLDPIAPPWWH